MRCRIQLEQWLSEHESRPSAIHTKNICMPTIYSFQFVNSWHLETATSKRWHRKDVFNLSMRIVLGNSSFYFCVSKSQKFPLSDQVQVSTCQTSSPDVPGNTYCTASVLCSTPVTAEVQVFSHGIIPFPICPSHCRNLKSMQNFQHYLHHRAAQKVITESQLWWQFINELCTYSSFMCSRLLVLQASSRCRITAEEGQGWSRLWKGAFKANSGKNIAKINISYRHDSALADLPLVYF